MIPKVYSIYKRQLVKPTRNVCIHTQNHFIMMQLSEVLTFYRHFIIKVSQLKWMNLKRKRWLVTYNYGDS